MPPDELCSLTSRRTGTLLKQLSSPESTWGRHVSTHPSVTRRGGCEPQCSSWGCTPTLARRSPSSRGQPLGVGDERLRVGRPERRTYRSRFPSSSTSRASGSPPRLEMEGGAFNLVRRDSQRSPSNRTPRRVWLFVGSRRLSWSRNPRKVRGGPLRLPGPSRRHADPLYGRSLPR